MNSRNFDESEVTDMEIALCKLNSMGELLTVACTTESVEPSLETLADLGRVISELADRTMNQVQDGRVVHPLK